jgi:hypothetical protein
MTRIRQPRSVLLAALAIATTAWLAPAPAAAQGAFAPTDAMNTPRGSHVAARLFDGRVFVACGTNGFTNPNTAELWDPATGLWTNTAPRTVGCLGSTATLLNDGRVLVAGNIGVSASASVYIPATGSWDGAGFLVVPRSYHTATKLDDGRVLVAGGATAIFGEHDSAEIYDPATNAWTSTGFFSGGRRDHTATLLHDGRVLLAGGRSTFPSNTPLATASIYNPITGTWSPTGSMNQARYWHTATLLDDGRVLIAGGTGASALDGAETYNPATGTFTPLVDMGSPRSGHTATKLSNGLTLIAGGFNGTTAVATGELFNPATNSFAPIASTMSTGRQNHTASVLIDGRVILAGGSGTSSADIYDPNVTVPACTLTLGLTYAGGTLTMNLTWTSTVATTLTAWASVGVNTVRIFSVPVPAAGSPVSVPVAFPLAPLDTIGFLTTMTTAGDGILCSAWQTIDTTP